jgi:hypothetical protein
VTVAALPVTADVGGDELQRFDRNGSFDLPPLFRFTFCDECGDWHWRVLREPVGVRVTEDEAAWLTSGEREDRRRTLAAGLRYRKLLPVGEIPDVGAKPESLSRIRQKLIDDARPLAEHVALIADGDFFGLTDEDRFELTKRSAASNVFRRPYVRRLTASHRAQLERGRLDLLEKGSKLSDKEVERRMACLSPDEWARAVAVYTACLLFQHSERLTREWDDSYPGYPPRRSRPIPSKHANWDLYLVRLLSIVRNEYVDAFVPGLQRWRAENERSGKELAKTRILSEFDPDAGNERSERGHDGDDDGDGGLVELASTDRLVDAITSILPGISADEERLLWLLVYAGDTREDASQALGKSKSWAGVVLKRLRDSHNPHVQELKWRLILDKAIGVIGASAKGATVSPRTHLGFWGIPAGSVAHTTRALRGQLLFPKLRKTDYSQPDFWNLCNETAPFPELVSEAEKRYRRRWWQRPHARLSVADALKRTSVALITTPMGRPLPDGHPSNVAFAIDFRRKARVFSLSPTDP